MRCGRVFPEVEFYRTSKDFCVVERIMMEETNYEHLAIPSISLSWNSAGQLGYRLFDLTCQK